MQFLSLTALFLLLSSFLVTYTTNAAPVSIMRREDDDDDNGDGGDGGDDHGGKTYHGQATWFVPADEGGPIGACGDHEDSDSLIVALNHDQYGDMDAKSDWCGKKILLKGPKSSMEVTIVDACPGCDYGSLDLTPRVFKKVVGDLDKGVGKISWHEV